MEITFTPELEARLNQIAAQTGQGPEQVIRDLVLNYIAHDEWFRGEVDKGLRSLEAKRFLSNEEVRNRIERILKTE